MSWTPERVETLHRLWADGVSCSEIAKRLGGITRSAVIGKVYRLGLTGREPPSKPKSLIWNEEMVAKLRELAGNISVEEISREMGIPTTKIHNKAKQLSLSVRVAPKPVAPPRSAVTACIRDIIADEPKPDANARGLLVTEMPTIGRCRFPVSGEGIHLRMCGEPTLPDTATYCVACARRAYQPKKQGAA